MTFIAHSAVTKEFQYVEIRKKMKESGHLKYLYCLSCKETYNHVECADYSKYDKNVFRCEFESGNFNSKGERIIPLNEWFIVYERGLYMVENNKIDSLRKLKNEGVFTFEEYIAMINLLNEMNHLKKDEMTDGIYAIVLEVAEYFNVSSKQIVTDNHEPLVVKARSISIYLSSIVTNASLTAIAKVFNKKDAGLIDFTIQNVKEDIQEDFELANDIDTIFNNIIAGK